MILNLSRPPPTPPVSPFCYCRPVTGFHLLKPPPPPPSCTRKQQLQLLQPKRKTRSGICRAVELPQDALFAIAIGACMLNSLIFTNNDTDGGSDEEDEDAAAAISSTDARFAVMTIISFIPYFNCLSWVFALMDTGKQRYAVYALVYLAPYLRSNFLLSPEESWLPIASIVLCIIHIQLEASIISGDLGAFNIFNEFAKRFGLLNLKKDRAITLGKRHNEQRRRDTMNLPSGQHQSRDEIRKWRVPTKPSEEIEHLSEDGDLDDTTKS